MSEHIGADDGYWRDRYNVTADLLHQMEVERNEAQAEVVRLRRELDARTDQPTADELQAALNVQFDAPVPVPAHWQPIQQAAYRDGWLDAMQRVKDSTDTAAAARLLGGGE